MVLIVMSVVAALVVLAVLLWSVQERLIYVPRSYAPAQLEHLPPGLVALRAEIPGAQVTSFYRAPAGGGAPVRVWLVFGGNADLALGWDDFAQASTQRQDGWLLIDYPGYGVCSGRPSPASMLAASDAAVAALSAHLALPLADVERRSAALGHSLGAAAASQYAARHAVQRLVLISPFTSTLEMARRMVGWPLCQVLTHRFDNRARLQEIAATGHTRIVIVHGDQDEVLPVAMGRALAQEISSIQLVIIPGAHHNDVLDLGAAAISAAMAE